MNKDTRQHGNVYLTIGVALITLIFLTLLVLYVAYKSGDLPILLLGFGVVCAIVALTWRQVTEGIKTLVIAWQIHKGSHYENRTPTKHGEGVLIINSYAAPALPAAGMTNSGGYSAAMLARLNDPARAKAVSLIETSVRENGPEAIQLISQTRAIELNIVTGGADHNDVIRYLCSNYGFSALNKSGSNNGVYCRTGENLLIVMRKMIADQLPGTER